MGVKSVWLFLANPRLQAAPKCPPPPPPPPQPQFETVQVNLHLPVLVRPVYIYIFFFLQWWNMEGATRKLESVITGVRPICVRKGEHPCKLIYSSSYCTPLSDFLVFLTTQSALHYSHIHLIHTHIHTAINWIVIDSHTDDTSEECFGFSILPKDTSTCWLQEPGNCEPCSPVCVWLQ